VSPSAVSKPFLQHPPPILCIDFSTHAAAAAVAFALLPPLLPPLLLPPDALLDCWPRSTAPSAFTGYAFHVVEALIVFANEIIVCFLFPLHMGLHRLYHILTTVIHEGGPYLSVRRCELLLLPGIAIVYFWPGSIIQAYMNAHVHVALRVPVSLSVLYCTTAAAVIWAVMAHDRPRGWPLVLVACRHATPPSGS